MSVEMGSALARPPYYLRCSLAPVWCPDYGCDSRPGCSGPRAQSMELAITAVPTIARLLLFPQLPPPALHTQCREDTGRLGYSCLQVPPPLHQPL